jgi:hypothetical protein
VQRRRNKATPVIVSTNGAAPGRSQVGAAPGRSEVGVGAGETVGRRQGIDLGQQR